MSTQPHPPARAAGLPRLNPFAFPAETDFRFWLLIVAVLGSSLFAYSLLFFSQPANQARFQEFASRCLSAGPTGLEQTPFAVLTSGTIEATLAAWTEVGRCMAPVNRTLAGWGAAGLALELACAGVLYWLFPYWKIRKDRLVPFTDEDDPQVVAELRRLVQVAGLRRPPVFLWNPLNLAPGGVAFGRLGKYSVALSGGLVTLFYTDLLAFRAVVLHELAHLRNQDIDKTYFTVAIWRVFVLVALLPMAFSLLGNPARDILGLGWRAGVLALFVYLSRNAVLRTRELYADVRASTWEGSGIALARTIGNLSEKGASRLKGLTRVHPDPAYRKSVLQDTGLLFRINFWDSLATGIAASISFAFLEALGNDFLPDASFLPAMLAGAALATLAAGVVGLEVWRVKFAAHALHRRPGSLVPAGLGLGLGIVLGRNLSFVRYIENGVTPLSLLDHAARLFFNLAWFAALVAGLLIWLSWMAGAASSWLEISAHGPSPRKITAAGLAAAGLLLSAWLSPLLWLAKYDGDAGQVGSAFLVAALAIPSVVASSPLTLLAVVCLWAFPLSAWFWHRRALPVSRASWAYLDSRREPHAGGGPLPLNPIPALGAGLLSGILFCMIILVVRVGLRIGFPDSVRETEQFKLLIFYGQIIGGVLFQAVLAASMALWIRRLGLAHGLCAAFVAGTVSVVGMLAVNLLLGGTIDLSFAWYTYSLTVNGGGLLSIPVAALASLTAGWLRRQRDRSGQAYDLAHV